MNYQHKQKRTLGVIWSIGCFVIAILAFGIISSLPAGKATADGSRVVSVFVDGQKKIVSGSYGTVGTALADAQVELYAGDLVEPKPETAIADGFYNVNVYRSRPVQIIDGPREYFVKTAYKSPRLVAEAAGLKVYPEDRFSIDAVRDITDSNIVGEKIVITRSTPVIIVSDGRSKVVRTHQKTVGGMLDERDVALGPKDIVETPRSASIKAGMVIKIFRVKTVEQTVEEGIARPVEEIKDPALEAGTTQVRQEGKDGKKRMIYRVQYQDGVEQKRERLSEAVVEQPQKKVIVVGTKPKNDAFARLRFCESGGRYDITREMGTTERTSLIFQLGVPTAAPDIRTRRARPNRTESLPVCKPPAGGTPGQPVPVS